MFVIIFFWSDMNVRNYRHSLILSKLHALYNSCLVNNVTNPNANLQQSSWVLPVRLFKHVGNKRKKDEIDKHSFLKLSFANKGLDGINLGNIPNMSCTRHVVLKVVVKIVSSECVIIYLHV
jgi:hypothetical protein